MHLCLLKRFAERETTRRTRRNHLTWQRLPPTSGGTRREEEEEEEGPKWLCGLFKRCTLPELSSVGLRAVIFASAGCEGRENRPHCILFYWDHFFLLNPSEALSKRWAGLSWSTGAPRGSAAHAQSAWVLLFLDWGGKWMKIWSGSERILITNFSFCYIISCRLGVWIFSAASLVFQSIQFK